MDTVTGEQPKERTEVRACWSPKHLHIRYLCEDSHTVSDFTMRDEPLYEQDVVDVVEVFIDEEGAGIRYMELVVSPNNVVYDALIENDGEAAITAMNVAWRFEGLQTAVEADGDARRLYFVNIPVENFKRPFERGLSWRVNFYRITRTGSGAASIRRGRQQRSLTFIFLVHSEGCCLLRT